MTPYTPNDTFTTAEILDLMDLVKGGSGGDANVPLKALADQAFYLLNRLMRYADVKQLAGSYTYDAVNDLRKMLVFSLSASATFTLPDVTAIATGTIIPIAVKTAGIKALTVAGNGGQLINDGSNDLAQMYMHDAERLRLVAASNTGGALGDHWEVEFAQGNFYNVGQIMQGYQQPKNSFVPSGQLVARADTPRLSGFALASSSIVTDANWLAGIHFGFLGFITNGYRAMFSQGTTGANYRLPDLRSMSIKFLDQGRGLDSARFNPTIPGGYEFPEVGEIVLQGQSGHDDLNFTNTAVFAGGDTPGPAGAFSLIVNNGQTNRIENIGLIPSILY